MSTLGIFLSESSTGDGNGRLGTDGSASAGSEDCVVAVAGKLATAVNPHTIATLRTTTRMRRERPGTTAPSAPSDNPPGRPVIHLHADNYQ